MLADRSRKLSQLLGIEALAWLRRAWRDAVDGDLP
jgi:hypothetical protein